MFLAHPAQSFAARKSRTSSAGIEVFQNEAPTAAFRRSPGRFSARQFAMRFPAILLTMADEQRNRDDWSEVMVTKLEHFKEGGNPCVRVRLEDQSHEEIVPWCAFTAVLSPADRFAVQSDLIELGQMTTLHGEYSYDRYGSLPVLRESNSLTTGRRRNCATKITVAERRFGPVPESEFSANGSWKVHRSRRPWVPTTPTVPRKRSPIGMAYRWSLAEPAGHGRSDVGVSKNTRRVVSGNSLA